VNEEKRGRGRPRREGADEEILSVARTMLVERGYRDLTVDAIADRAGVAKTTIYRRWPSKGVLVAAAIAPDAPLSRDVAQLLADTAALLSLLGTSTGDAEILGVVRAILAPRRIALIELLGDETRADELLGAVWMRLFVGPGTHPAASN
jgi:AcrR family transcriptional regulator